MQKVTRKMATMEASIQPQSPSSAKGFAILFTKRIIIKQQRALFLDTQWAFFWIQPERVDRYDQYQGTDLPFSHRVWALRKKLSSTL
jgi:hypothetical protein